MEYLKNELTEEVYSSRTWQDLRKRKARARLDLSALSKVNVDVEAAGRVSNSDNIALCPVTDYVNNLIPEGPLPLP
jgi:hypothetical protein